MAWDYCLISIYKTYKYNCDSYFSGCVKYVGSPFSHALAGLRVVGVMGALIGCSDRLGCDRTGAHHHAVPIATSVTVDISPCHQ